MKGSLTAVALAFGLVLTTASTTLLTAEDFVKIRCSVDGSDVYYKWAGSIYSYTPQEKQKHLLNFIGYNVARCEKIDHQWYLITREISYYTDPKTNEKIDSWTNPYTEETVPVVHVANDPVNSGMGGLPASKLDDFMVIDSDVNLYYPNPLHDNHTYWPYSGSYPDYEGGEYFKFYYDAEDLKEATNYVVNVPISWTRFSQWLPWMKMGSTVGHIFYSCSGSRIKDLSSMPEWLLDEINTRMPLYLNAPSTFDPEAPNESSLTYFKKHFEEYLNGDQFPIAAPKEYE